MKKLKSIISLLIIVGSFLSFITTITHTNFFENFTQSHNRNSNMEAAVVITVPAKYPETAQHVKEAILKGESPYCTIDRSGADKRREESLRGIPVKHGLDRDEFPMAMCLEGGSGADIRYIHPGDNRGAGAWVGRKLSNYPDGTIVKFNQK